MLIKSSLVLWFSEVDKTDVALVGGKGANLGEMVQAGFPVPNGFIVSSHAYFTFIRENNLTTKIKGLLSTANFERPDSLMQVSAHVKKLILRANMSEDLIREIFFSYRKLSGIFRDAQVAVRSSAAAEDLPTASLAGQQETYLNVKGEANLLLKIKEGWASLFEPRAIFYRHEKKFDHFRVGIAMVVQKMVESDRSGVMFTVDPVTNDKTKIVIEAIYGLGEMIVQGQVTPDHIEVGKSNLEVINKVIANQGVMLKKAGQVNKEVRIPAHMGAKQKLTHNQIIDLAILGKKLEKHYYFPQDIEWAIEKGRIYIVQTRAITTIHNKVTKQEDLQPTEKLQLLLKGAPASPGIATGPVKVIASAKEINKVNAGDVLVAAQTNPDYVPAMKKAAAIVTDHGGWTSHAAIVSRELGIPAIVGTETATKLLKPGLIVTVNGALGAVYKGSVHISQNEIAEDTQNLKTATRVYVNLAQPNLAEKIAQKNVDGVGLLRAEFMMEDIGVHPKKMLKEGRGHVYSERLAEQISIICKAFNPRPVVYRASDFKTNEYRNLEGGREFEQTEPNPMLGYRGAYRYIHDPEVFKLELETIKIVRQQQGLKNLWMMVPFCRTVRELEEVKRIMSVNGLHRSPTFKLWMMVEIPANVILLDKFIEAGIDGVSIGSNDLTMLVLGTDRDNSEVAAEFDERNPAVLWALEQTIKIAHKHGITSSLCGQAASLYPDLLERLVRWGITSVSVSPDVIESVREKIFTVERELLSKHHYGKD